MLRLSKHAGGPLRSPFDGAQGDTPISCINTINDHTDTYPHAFALHNDITVP
jgi:hypothetical protein